MHILANIIMVSSSHMAKWLIVIGDLLCLVLGCVYNSLIAAARP